jgi:hypothetical protein
MHIESTALSLMPRTPDPQIRRAILSALREHADFCGAEWGPDTSQLATWLGRPYMTIKKYTDRLIVSGHLEFIGAKRWLRITAAGRKDLAASNSVN